MRHLCLFLIALIPTIGFAKVKSDTIIVYVDNRLEMKIAIPDFAEKSNVSEVVTALKELESLLPDIKDQLNPDGPELIKYTSGNSVTIEPGDPKTIFLEKDGRMSNTGFRDQAIIATEKSKIWITTTDISKVNDWPVSSCFEHVVAELPDYIRWSKTISYECIDGKVKELESKNNEFDMLGLQAGAGAGLIKGQWVADLSFGVSLGLNKKGVSRGPYISSNMIFDFDAENNVNINTFLNLGYKWTLNSSSKDPMTFGMDIGYLAWKQGDLFGENTVKLSFNWSPAKHVYVSPQLYVTDNFKQAFPGVRIGFGF